MAEVPKKSGRGGARPGAGRKKKVRGGGSQLGELDLKAAMDAPPPDEIDGVAQQHVPIAIGALAKILTHGSSESAKITAAKEVLDRGYGKPAVEIGGDAMMLPFMMQAATAASVSLTAQIRKEARRYANLAIEVLRSIAERGLSETARAGASKALLDRGLGTVGKARMPDEQRDQPLGKKEQAAQAARLAGTGRYATPPPPRMADSIQ